MAYAASHKKMPMSLVFTNSAISSLAVCSILVNTAQIPSSIAFTVGFLMLAGLCFTPYVAHRAQKCSLNSLPLSYIKYQQQGYL
jgi:hypothetical protein